MQSNGPSPGQHCNKNSLPSFRIAKRWGSIWTTVELRGETHIEIYISLMFQTGRIYNNNRIYYKLVFEVWKLSRITVLIVLFLVSFPKTHPNNIFTSNNYWPPVCFEVHLPWKQAVFVFGSVLCSLKWGGHSCGTPRTLLFIRPQSGLPSPLFKGAQLPVWHIVKRSLKWAKRQRGRHQERGRKGFKKTWKWTRIRTHGQVTRQARRVCK